MLYIFIRNFYNNGPIKKILTVLEREIHDKIRDISFNTIFWDFLIVNKPFLLILA